MGGETPGMIVDIHYYPATRTLGIPVWYDLYIDQKKQPPRPFSRYRGLLFSFILKHFLDFLQCARLYLFQGGGRFFQRPPVFILPESFLGIPEAVMDG